MTLTKRQRNIIDVAQWILIGIMLFVCTVVYVGNVKLSNEDRVLKKESTYIKIYSDHRINELEKENKELADSLLKITEKLKETTVN